MKGARVAVADSDDPAALLQHRRIARSESTMGQTGPRWLGQKQTVPTPPSVQFGDDGSQWGRRPATNTAPARTDTGLAYPGRTLGAVAPL